ncbi:GCD complex subunit gcd7 [Ceratobasidium sp. 394]|nr:GCD complex subunit gcd7 [Ceratobasidium sp. 394]
MSELIKDKGTLRNVEALVAKLRRRQVTGAHDTAVETVLLLRQVVSTARFSSLAQLLAMLRSVGTRLVAAQPKEIAVGNMVRRVIHQVREEYHANTGGVEAETQHPPGITRTNTLSAMSAPDGSTLSLANFVLLGRPRTTARPTREQEKESGDLSRRSLATKPALIDAIKEIVDELETVFEGVAKNAKNHIHADEIVLTIGYSRTVEAFLKAAAHEKKFTVIVAETAPAYTGHQMATALSQHNISTFLVPDSSIFALMSRVTKLILGAHAVLADGGIVAQAGALAAAAAARAHATSVVVCAGQFKFAPLWSWTVEDAGAADYGDPGSVLGYEEGELLDGVEVVNPKYDYVKPEFLDVIVTNYGDHPPSYVYKLVKEMYEDEDLAQP